MTIGADLLYWKMDICGMDYVFTNDKPLAVNPQQEESTSIVGDLKSVDFQWDPGVRLTFGYICPPSCMEIEADYTHYYTTNNETVLRPTGNNPLITGTLPEFYFGEMASANSKFKFHYHVAKLGIARKFCWSDYFSLKFIAGIQGAWLKEDWRVTYLGIDENHTFHKNNWKYGAGGLHLGLKTDWYLGCGFKAYLNGSCGALYGSHSTFSFIDPEAFTGGYFQDFSPEDTRVATAGQIQGGLSWCRQFNCFLLNLFICYELNTWFNVHEQYRVSFGGQGSTNPLNEKVRILTTCPVNLQGLTAGFSLEY